VNSAAIIKKSAGRRRFLKVEATAHIAVQSAQNGRGIIDLYFIIDAMNRVDYVA
jgi:hypothetical protein